MPVPQTPSALLNRKCLLSEHASSRRTNVRRLAAKNERRSQQTNESGDALRVGGLEKVVSVLAFGLGVAALPFESGAAEAFSLPDSVTEVVVVGGIVTLLGIFLPSFWRDERISTNAGFGGNQGNMGGRISTAVLAKKGWEPSPAGVTTKKMSKSGFDVTPLTIEEKKEAAAKLTPLQKNVNLEEGTERAFTGSTTNGYSHDNKAKGVYVGALSGLPLFSSETKYDSGTGWPSFYDPVDPEHVIEVVDRSIPFMPRTEVIDAKSGAHLGHVFNDGPRPTGKRYCMNAASLTFIPEEDSESKE